jgi:capsular exopolysaccharide synthesis family protein
VDPGGPVAICFQHFAWKVRQELEARGARSVAVTSALPQEGKTVTACNLAISLASLSGGGRIALAELDLRHPALAGVFGIRPTVGIEAVLLGKASLEQACIETDQNGLDVFLVGEPVKDAHELLAGPRLGQAVDDLVQSYDAVVFDTAPVLPVPDTSLLLRHAELCVAVVRSGTTPQTALQEMRTLLPAQKCMGIFMNCLQRPPRREYRYDR